MTATRLGLYNGALLILGERKLASLTENREPRRVLDDIWADGFVDYVLEQGLWQFAMRTAETTYDPSSDPAFGYTRAFNKPSDFIRTGSLSADESFTSPLLDYADKQGYWFANLDTVYVDYVSNDSEYGGDLSTWPETFTQYAEHYMALKASKRLTQSPRTEEDLRALTRRALVDARSKDAMAEPTKFMPAGSWASARRGGSRSKNGGWNGSFS